MFIIPLPTHTGESKRLTGTLDNVRNHETGRCDSFYIALPDACKALRDTMTVQRDGEPAIDSERFPVFVPDSDYWFAANVDITLEPNTTETPKPKKAGRPSKKNETAETDPDFGVCVHGVCFARTERGIMLFQSVYPMKNESFIDAVKRTAEVISAVPGILTVEGMRR